MISPSLASIYEPIQQELLQVEENLRQVTKVDSPYLAKPLHHVLSNGGKRIRPALTLLAGKFYHYNLKLLLPIATAVELLHTATLVHDDTIDNSPQRRGKPTLNSLWDNSTAILLGDYLFATSAYVASQTRNLRVMRLFAHTLMSICSGELDETSSAFDLSQLRTHYYWRIGNKTASLFSLAAQSGAILSKAPKEVVQALRDYSYNLGMGFQIVDDIFDFEAEGEEIGKPVGSDLLRGVLTLPTIVFLESHPEGDSVKGISDLHDNLDKLNLVVGKIRQPSNIAQCYAIAAQFCSQGCSALNALPQNSVHQALVGLADYVITRRR